MHDYANPFQKFLFLGSEQFCEMFLAHNLLRCLPNATNNRLMEYRLNITYI